MVSVRREDQVDAAGERQRRTRRSQQALAGEVDGDQRRRAGGVDRQARAAEVEAVGEPVGGDAEALPVPV